MNRCKFRKISYNADREFEEIVTVGLLLTAASGALVANCIIHNERERNEKYVAESRLAESQPAEYETEVFGEQDLKSYNSETQHAKD